MFIARWWLHAVLTFAVACGPGNEEWVAEPPEAASDEAAGKPPPMTVSPRLDQDVPGKPTSLESERFRPALAWTVSLSIFPTNMITYVGSPITVTATANQDVGPTPYYIRIYDGSGLLASCGSGQSCSAQVTSSSFRWSKIEARIVRSDGSDQQAQDNEWLRWEYGHPKVSANLTTLAVGATSTVTAKVDLDVGPTPWYIQLYDVTTGTRIAACGVGTSCSANVSQAAATTYTFKAFISGATTAFPPPGALESSVHGYVTWSSSGYTLQLTSPEFIPYGTPATITATANVNVSSTPYWITIYRQDTGEKLKSCGYSSTCSVNYQGAPNSTLYYAAFISADSASFPPPGIQASANVTATRTGNYKP